MDLVSDRGRRITVDELNTTQLLAHARKEAIKRNFDDMLIVDVDAHHYENEHMAEILPFMENEVQRQLLMSAGLKGGRSNFMPGQIGYQDVGGRVTRYPLRYVNRVIGQNRIDQKILTERPQASRVP